MTVSYPRALSDAEQRAYAAAHEIMRCDLSFSDLATPGGRQSAKVDAVAEIILKHIEQHI